MSFHAAMATITKEKLAERTVADLRKDDQIEGEEDWGGPKLVVLGIISLGAALVFLYMISPYSGVILP